jgi:phosphoribosylamine--glycine ligase
VLYVGVMLTDDGPKVLEFNVRFGDPETQVLLPRLDGDWLALLGAAASGDLRAETPRWKSDAAVCVVMTAGGYPGPHATGQPIHGLERAERMECVEVFHAGTASGAQGRTVTAGGRVLGVTALGADLGEARERAYRAVGEISWDGERHRTDIALDAVETMARRSE